MRVQERGAQTPTLNSELSTVTSNRVIHSSPPIPSDGQHFPVGARRRPSARKRVPHAARQPRMELQELRALEQNRGRPQRDGQVRPLHVGDEDPAEPRARRGDSWPAHPVGAPGARSSRDPMTRETAPAAFAVPSFLIAPTSHSHWKELLEPSRSSREHLLMGVVASARTAAERGNRVNRRREATILKPDSVLE